MADIYRLLVEGSDDQHLIRRLLERRNIGSVLARGEKKADPRSIVIAEKGGYGQLRDSLRVELDVPELERLGIVVDADVDANDRWTSLRNHLTALGGVGIPETLSPGGTLFNVERTEKTVTVGVWVMPDNTRPGMLEHFVASLISSNDVLWPRAEQVVAQIPQDERRFRPQHEIKAHAHTWLAWQEEPGRPYGVAMTFGWLDAKSPAADAFISWIRQLYAV
jgi:hypothetical protein